MSPPTHPPPQNKIALLHFPFLGLDLHLSANLNHALKVPMRMTMAIRWN